MKTFQFTIRDELGILARPAGMLAKISKSYGDTNITITKGDKTVKTAQLMKLMGLSAKKGDTVTVQAEGPSEEEAIAALQDFFEKNL